jgi:uncharacterized protein (TIGR03118 family)
MKRFCISLVMLLWLASAAKTSVFSVRNLVTDNQTVNAALIADPTLTNAWGISFGPTSPFWVSANGSGTSTIYQVDHLTDNPTKIGLTVSIPGNGSVTGQVYNGNATAFNNDLFLFVSEDGTISGWRGALGTTAEVLVLGDTANVYKGATEATIGGNSYLYAANFRAGRIDIIKGTAGAPDLAGNFTDPGTPSGYAPFNIENLGNNLYVTYALQDANQLDDVAGPGHGFVSSFDTQGNFLGRIGSQGTLNSPWGLAIAPASFGPFAGDLLVGNFGDGKINAFNLATNSFVDQLQGVGGQPLSIDGLWALTVGNGGSAGNSQSIYFSAGPNGESNGLFGVIAPVPEPSTFTLLCMGVVALGAFAWRRKRIGSH